MVSESTLFILIILNHIHNHKIRNTYEGAGASVLGCVQTAFWCVCKPGLRCLHVFRSFPALWLAELLKGW